jgi:hypothetical protein
VNGAVRARDPTACRADAPRSSERV